MRSDTRLNTFAPSLSPPLNPCYSVSSPSLYYSSLCLSLLPLLVTLPYPLPPQANLKWGSMTMAESGADYEDEEEGSAGGSEGSGGGGRMDNTYGSIDLMDDTLPSIGGSTKKSGKSVTINVPPTPEHKGKHSRGK
jgi:hypothetical protein